MKALSTILVALLASILAIVAFARGGPSPAKKPPDYSSQNGKYFGVGSAASCDSIVREGMWAALLNGKKASDIKARPPANEEIDNIRRKSYLGREEFEVHMDWSFQDVGPAESSVQTEVVALDKAFGTNMYGECISAHFGPVPYGRACLMTAYACPAAKGGSDDQAFRIAVSTQLHNDEAVATLRKADVGKVVAYLQRVCP
jgi:hypothetical protein